MTQQDRDTAYHHMSGAQEFNASLGKRERLATYHFRRSVVNRHTPENATEIKRETLEEFLARGASTTLRQRYAGCDDYKRTLRTL